MNKYENQGLTEQNIVNLIVYKDDVIAFLRDIQNEWRIKRGIQKDPEDKLLHGSESIDDILERIDGLEQFLQQYREEMARIEKEKQEEKNRKK